MLLSEFDYELPHDLIAQEPLANRDGSRMLVVDRTAQNFTDHTFSELPSFLRSGDVLVLNNTRVFPARLIGRSETGANVEIFLVREVETGVWETLARPARRLHEGKQIIFSDDLSGVVAEKEDSGRLIVRFDAAGHLNEAIDRVGRTPLPPYIKRDSDSIDRDRERYQTVFARERGAIAAPTAGLHFTPQTMDAVRSSGVEIVEVTLHVGYGTFEPVRVDDLTLHRVAAERASISSASAAALESARLDRRRIVAVGTTTTRVLETAMAKFSEFRPAAFDADLTITPGYRFRAIGALLTNFHLPKSSLLVLTSTFGGHELIMNSYRHAVAQRYRFYSYGDCMFIL
ncbi:MAG: tRNA preQ1(34) S-adenosylmethionine ribosyltransferase-isomerase QueA [Acidobacteria bacterium]|nr:tRNA preQ1(34) S-adenosylmethionine ribosyltransferase-isomerase QueA [Acidobacteriota bacterium]